jgi:hypothetical protein
MYVGSGPKAKRPTILTEISTAKAGGRRTVIRSLADTGATSCFLSKRAADRIGLVAGGPCCMIKGMGAKLQKSIGEAMVWMRVAEVEEVKLVRVVIVEHMHKDQDLLISLSELVDFGLVHKEFPRPYRKVTEEEGSGPHSGPHQLPAARHQPAGRGGSKGEREMEKVLARERNLRGNAPPERGRRERMDGCFRASEVEAETLDINTCLFRYSETDDVSEIPGLAGFPDVIKQLILKHRSVFANKLDESRKITGDPMKLTVRENATLPPKCTRARLVPRGFRERAKEIIDVMVKSGILIPVSEVTATVCAGFFVRKRGGGLRFVSDFSPINHIFLRPHHHFPSPGQVWQQIKEGSRYFLACDLSSGYWQCQLAEESQAWTTCLTEFGKFKHSRLPMGTSPSGDLFNQKTDTILHEVKDKVKEVDDLMLYAATLEQLAANLEVLLSKCEEHNLTLAPKKFQLALPGEQLIFAGLSIGDKGCGPDPDRMKALAEYPRPGCKKQIRELLGLCQQFSVWAPDLSPATVNMRNMLKQTSSFVWSPECEEEFLNVKEALSNNKHIKAFDPELESDLFVDTSRISGAGYILIQHTGKEEEPVNIIRCGSVSAKPSWANMAPVEAEGTGLAWAVGHCEHYLKGSDKTIGVVTDHHPLVGIFKKSIFDLSTRLWNVRSAIMDYNLRVRWVEGKRQLVADALGRNPVWKGSEENNDKSESDEEPEASEHANIAEEYADSGVFEEEFEDPMLTELFEEARADESYQKVLEELRKGRDKKDLKLLPNDHPARAMVRVWDEISVMQRGSDKLMVYEGTRLVIPSKCRQRIRDYLHAPHLGRALTYAAGRIRYYWPTMREELHKIVDSCEVCGMFAPSRQEEEEVQEMYKPRRPMDLVATDLFQLGNKHFLVALDVYSGYCWYHQFNRCPDTHKVTEALSNIFLTFGMPRHLKADGGGQYRAGFKRYCREMYITHHGTSPFHSQSNGAAEKCVGRIKILMKKVHADGGDMRMAFARLRDAPSATEKLSASRIFFRRQLRFAGLPELPDGEDEVEAGRDKQVAAERAKDRRNQRVSKFGRSVVELKEGLAVVVQDERSRKFDIPAVVQRVCEGGRSAYLEARDRAGRPVTMLRNRKFMDLPRRGGKPCGAGRAPPDPEGAAEPRLTRQAARAAAGVRPAGPVEA